MKPKTNGRYDPRANLVRNIIVNKPISDSPRDKLTRTSKDTLITN